MESFQDLIEAADLNALLRAVDALCGARDWDGLVELADRCDDALERGKQLWPISAHIDYRLALEAPGEYAGHVLHPEVGRFATGPLTEVAASTHSWEELAPHIEDPRLAAYVAQERVLRGEVLDGDERAHPEVLDLPLHLEEWEPSYALATYRSDHVEVAEPWTAAAALETVRAHAAPPLADEELENALLDLVQPWVAESNGAARAVVVEGDALGAASAIAFDTLRFAELSLEGALQRIAWAAASGGAHGRRRGATLGRFMAFYLTSLATGLQWPPSPELLGDRLREVRWYYWDEGQEEKGWVLRIAIEHPREGWAAALGATDLLEEE